MVRNNQLVDKIAGWSLAILAITRSLAVMHGDSTLGNPAITTLLLAAQYICLLLLLPSVAIGRGNSNKTYALLLAICVTLYYVISFINAFKDPSFNIVLFVIMICFCFSNNNTKLIAYKIYRYFLIVTAFLGIIAYVSYIFSLGIPYRIVPFYDRIDTNYVDFKFAYLTTRIFTSRLCGLFNEAGYFGTIIALVLIADNVNLRKIGNIILLVAGILTFSLAYFILIIFAVLYRGLKDRTTIIIVLLTALALAVALPVLSEKFPEVELLLDRFMFNDGEWVGDNRSSDSVDLTFMKMFTNNENLAFGYGSGYLKYLDETGTSSYKGLIIDYGLVGTILFLGLLFLSARSLMKSQNVTKRSMLLLICFFLSVYQRPHVIAINFLLVLFGGILFIEEEVKSQNHLLTNKNIKNETSRHHKAL